MGLHMCDMVFGLHLGEYPKYHHDTLKFLKVYKHLDHIKTKLHCSSDDTYLLSSRLRLLHWDAFPLTAFPCRFCPLDLVEVSLHRSNLTSFWKQTVVKALKRSTLSTMYLLVIYVNTSSLFLLNYTAGDAKLEKIGLVRLRKSRTTSRSFHGR